ncbi:MAG: HAD-IIIA family hydrolase [Gammaproteobacteria bacterium]|nr:HAD-IIIA family hydrolase [Gammaproteobacteria bacterium]MCW5584345.1 HAD-IIIA family hydrolase [Gammaproteobacteria bacterium]
MQTIIEKAKTIRLLVLDVDGILTTGRIYYGSNAFEMRGFHIHDGLGIKLIQKTGVMVAIISGKHSDIVAKRLHDLDVQHVYLGHEIKLPAYEDLKHKLQIKDHEIAYMGDDLPDLPLLRRVGLSITVPQAPASIKQYVDLITKKKAGKGAVREVCELIMQAQDQYQSVIQSYLK